MTHLLIIRNAAGNELARVPVEAGYTIKEVALKEKKQEPKSGSDKEVAAGDAGSGTEKVG